MSLNLNNHAVYNIGIKCEVCVHKDICKYKEKYQQITEKFNKMVEEDNVNFLDFSCKYFSYSSISTTLITGGTIRDSDITISRAPETKEIKYTPLKG